jgi:hypothetical protein
LAALNLRNGNPVLGSDSIDKMLNDFIGWDYPQATERHPEPSIA